MVIWSGHMIEGWDRNMAAVTGARNGESVKQRADREILERIIDERDRLYDMRFRAAEIAVNAALAAQEKAVTAAFLASEKAIIKAEEAQKDYNVRSNEFRGQLDDQAKMLMPRTESIGLHKSTAEKIEDVRNFFDSRFEAQSHEIASLRESRSMIEGRGLSQREITGYIFGAAGIAVALAALYFKAQG